MDKERVYHIIYIDAKGGEHKRLFVGESKKLYKTINKIVDNGGLIRKIIDVTI